MTLIELIFADIYLRNPIREDQLDPRHPRSNIRLIREIRVKKTAHTPPKHPNTPQHS